MSHEKKTPALGCAGEFEMFTLPANVSEDNSQSLVLQFLRRRYGIAPEVGATIAALAGIGPREVRS